MTQSFSSPRSFTTMNHPTRSSESLVHGLLIVKKRVAKALE